TRSSGATCAVARAVTCAAARAVTNEKWGCARSDDSAGSSCERSAVSIVRIFAARRDAFVGDQVEERAQVLGAVNIIAVLVILGCCRVASPMRPADVHAAQ